MSGEALAMRVQLGRLAVKHHAAALPITVPLSPPTDHPQVLIGLAATLDVDLDRTKLRAYAFGWPLMFRHGLPPLLHKHDESAVAGVIDELSYDARGQLLVRATVTHEQARRCNAFSIRAKVLDYEMRDVESDRFYAVINQAELIEISTTDCPANPQAIVQRRYRASPKAEFFALMGERVARLSRLTALIKGAQP